MRIFNIGEVVWIARYGRREFQDPCPVCFGKLSVTVILGNGELVETPCSYCGLGWDGPRGWTSEYRIEPSVKSVIITGREIQEGESTEVTYRGSGGHCYLQEIVFETEAEAFVKSEELCTKEIKDSEIRSEYIKKDKIKSFAWNVGYHLREAKRIREQIAYHERMAILCKERAKGGKNADQESK